MCKIELITLPIHVLNVKVGMTSIELEFRGYAVWGDKIHLTSIELEFRGCAAWRDEMRFISNSSNHPYLSSMIE